MRPGGFLCQRWRFAIHSPGIMPKRYRAVPVPPALLEALDLVHGIRELQGLRGKGRGVRL